MTGHEGSSTVGLYADHAQERDFAEVSKAVEEAFGRVITF